MTESKILTLIMAGGAGNRMELLTEVRAKPALPFAGTYRLIDFPLSHCVHSGLKDVWVIEQFEPHSINDHLINGRPWDLDRTRGGLRILPPYQGSEESGWHQGNADAIYRNRRFIREFGPDLVLVLSADHIYKLDYRAAIEFHLAHNADVTIVTTERPIEQASRHAVVQVDNQGKVTQFAYKPDEPQSTTVATEVFVYNAAKLLDTIDRIADQKRQSDGSVELKDFGHELLPMLVEDGRAFAFPLDGYWRDVGTIEAYYEAHMDLLESPPPIVLDAPDWPILTNNVPRLPARIHGSATIDHSLIAMGCEVRGSVINSVLAPGVIVEAGASVRNAIVGYDVRIEREASVAYAIVDDNATIGSGARIGSAEQADQITLVGQRAQVPANTSVAAGQRVRVSATADEIASGAAINDPQAEG